jgi:hypothetical protein
LGIKESLKRLDEKMREIDDAFYYAFSSALHRLLKAPRPRQLLLIWLLGFAILYAAAKTLYGDSLYAVGFLVWLTLPSLVAFLRLIRLWAKLRRERSSRGTFSRI